MKGVTRRADPKRPQAKTRQARRSKGGRRKENAVLRYFRQTWAELKKTHWPTRREARNLTMIVLAVTVVMSAFLGVVDWLAALFFSLLINMPG